jgi:hypothetical protein
MDQPERRSSRRQRTLKGALIAFNTGRSTIECVVRNMSDTGAKLQVSSVVGIPDVFELRLSDGARHPCRVVWRSLKELGVVFESSAAE